MKLPLYLESSDLSLLEPEFSELLRKTLKKCEEKGLRARVGCAMRGPGAQARMWCQNKSPDNVASMVGILQKSAPKISALIAAQPCGMSPQGSWHMPGDSWHQHGEAADLWVEVKDSARWIGGLAELVAEEVRKVGLYHSHFERHWNPRGRHWHAQLRKEETPLSLRGFADSWSRIEEMMVERFDFDEFQKVSTTTYNLAFSRDAFTFVTK